MEMPTETECDRARRFQSLFERYTGESFAIHLWDGWTWNWPERSEPRCTLIFKNPAALTMLMEKPSEIAMGEAYLAGEIDLEGDIFAVFEVAGYLFHTPQARRKHVVEMLSF